MKRIAVKRIAIKRRPVRLRLTLIYSGLFLLGGVVLLAVTYGLVARSLSNAAPSTGAMNTAYKICAAQQPTRDAVARCDSQAQQVATAARASQRDQTLSQLLDYSAVALAGVTVVSTVLGWVMAGRALRPVHAITTAARQASEENLGDRIALAGPDDELKELADTFDAMLGRLDAAFASQRRFVANASHELRTPLAVMRAAIDVALAKPDRTQARLEAMAVEVRQAVERAETLIEALLTLARSDRGAGPREPLDVAVLAEDALDAAARAIKACPLTVAATLRPSRTSGDPVLIERLVTNLVDNAVRYNTADGWIQVETGARGGMAFIDITNTGDPVPDDLVPDLFEPFRRGSPASGQYGAGLGLSIVRSVAAAHHGEVTARQRPDGGLQVSVLLPASADHDRGQSWAYSASYWPRS